MRLRLPRIGEEYEATRPFGVALYRVVKGAAIARDAAASVSQVSQVGRVAVGAPVRFRIVRLKLTAGERLTYTDDTVRVVLLDGPLAGVKADVSADELNAARARLCAADVPDP